MESTESSESSQQADGAAPPQTPAERVEENLPIEPAAAAKQEAKPDPKAAALSDTTRRFTTHAMNNEQADRATRLKDRFRQLAEQVVLDTPISREQSTVLTLLDQASMLATAAIARNEQP
jgi:hypothetical protein